MPYSEYLDLQLAFDNIVNLIQKQEKIIDLMARDIAAEDENDEEIVNYIKQEYFKKVVEEDE